MSLVKHLKNRFLTGLFLLIPLIVTIYVIYFIVTFFEPFLGPPLNSILSRIVGRDVYIPGVAFFLFVIITYVTGVLASNYFGKIALARGGKMLKRIPFVKTVYSSVKDMTEAFSSDKIKSFKEAVLVEFPFPGRYVIAFVTQRMDIKGQKYCSVFIPPTPIPTAGFLVLVKEEELVFLRVPIDDALKYLISVGTTKVEIPWEINTKS